MDASGNQGYGTDLSFTTGAAVNHPPSAPVLTAIAGDAVVNLEWTAGIDPDGESVRYEVYRSTDGGAYTALSSVTGLSFVDSGVQNGTVYRYVVRAIDGNLAYTDSEPVSATPQIPDYNAYVIQNPAATYGSLTGDYTSLHPNIPGVQSLSEQKVGPNGRLDLHYLLQTSANPGEITTMALRFSASFQPWDDAWRIYLWTSGAWVDITTAVQSGTPTVDPLACVDPNGFVRVRFTDSVAKKSERLDSISIEHLYAEITVGPIANRAPVAVDDTGLSKVVAVAAGSDVIAVIRADRTVIAWGAAASGRRSVPPVLTNIVAIAVGHMHSLALRADGTITSWGLNVGYYDGHDGVVGWGSLTPPPDLTNVVAVAAGYMHNLALRADGRVVAWGEDAGGGTRVPADLTNVVAIAAGMGQSLALRANGNVVAWGKGRVAAAGSARHHETTVPSGLTDVAIIGSFYRHNLALKTDGTVVAWGWNDRGQTDVPPGLRNVVGIAAGYFHSVALIGDGRRPVRPSFPPQRPALLSSP